MAEDGENSNKKWARKQTDRNAAARFQRSELHTGEYNIWYNRYQVEKQNRQPDPATTRCVAKRDSGLTRADLSKQPTSFCIYFARGCCWLGRECQYYHHIPLIEDAIRLSNDKMHDCFGRERHSTDRDDMGGIGTFARESRTLYIGRAAVLNVDKARKTLEKHFSEWGPIEQIDIKPVHGCAFIRYNYRTHAEFAKVAMADQKMDENEQINVRWAHDDPNPRVKVAIQHRYEDTVLDAVLEKEMPSEDSKEQQDILAATLSSGAYSQLFNTQPVSFAAAGLQVPLPLPSSIEGGQGSMMGHLAPPGINGVNSITTEQQQGSTPEYNGASVPTTTNTTPMTQSQYQEHQQQLQYDKFTEMLNKIDSSTQQQQQEEQQQEEEEEPQGKEESSSETFSALQRLTTQISSSRNSIQQSSVKDEIEKRKAKAMERLRNLIGEQEPDTENKKNDIKIAGKRNFTDSTTEVKLSSKRAKIQ